MYELTNEIESALKTTPKQRWENNRDAIATLNELSSSGRTPTPDELNKLALFNGWGAIPTVFDLNPTGWAKQAQSELQLLLGEEKYALAAESILNAHYTDFSIIRAIWDKLTAIGFNGGRILEPSCGTGFFFGCMPKDIQNNSQIYGVELDKTAAKVASYLYPSSTIYDRGFEAVEFPDEYFDLIIGNVPFGSYKVPDPKYDFLGLSIHNYFFAKSRSLVRVGGLIAMITSQYTLDAPGTEGFRRHLGADLRLLAAIRLPAGAFKEIAGTMVSPDLLIFQKISNKDSTNVDDWAKSELVSIYPSDWGRCGQSGKANLNLWYAKEFSERKTDHRYQKADSKYSKYLYTEVHNLLGTPAVNQLYGEGFALIGDDRNLTEAIAAVPIDCSYNSKANNSEVLLVPPELQNVKPMAFCEYFGQLYQRDRDRLIKSSVEPKRVHDYWQLRETLTELLQIQSSATADELTECQERLRGIHKAFTQIWGKVNAKVNLLKLGKDPGYYLVRTIEKSNGTLADILSKRVCREYNSPVVADNATEALVHSLNTNGFLDLEFMSKLLDNRPIADITAELESTNQIFFDPTLNEWVLSEEYLSGNVYQKLQSAISHNLGRNIAALKVVQPKPMLPDADNQTKIGCIEALGIDWNAIDENTRIAILEKTIAVGLGANWIPAKVYRRFADEILRINVRISYAKAPASLWIIKGKSDDTTEYGTQYLNSAEILEKGLNNQSPQVTIRDSKDEINRVASFEETEAARAKLELMRNAFTEWLWSDRPRAIELCLFYNQNINVFVERKYDGSWLKLPGSNPDIQLNPWQLNAVARIVANQGTLLAHDVGLGKTFTFISAIMECRRLGLVQRPMLVVLNSTVKQIESDWRRLYPMANLLVPDSLDAEGRKLFTAAIATADFDGVILTHSQFFTLAMGPDCQLAYHSLERDLLLDLISDSKGDRSSSKAFRRALKFVEARIAEVTSSKRKDNHIDFEQLGVDMLVLDEIHKFKNLAINTKMTDIRGIQTSRSQRASDTYMKILHVLNNLLSDSCQKVSGKVVGATGTILSNTMAELFNWQRMFQLPLLKELGIESFDSWASQFGRTSTGAEIGADCQYKVVTRFKRFVNLQVLRSLTGQFLDIVTASSVGSLLERPEAKYIDVAVPPTDAQLQFLRDALLRSEAIKNRLVEPDQDNMLKVTTDLTKAALSMRLLGEDTEAPESKLHECALNVWKIWSATESVKGVQLVFCDFSTPKSDRYNVYAYLKQLLVGLGIPIAQIAFIHDHDRNRAAFFDSVNSGKVRIVLGSTEKLGTGCNVHKGGLWALHHVDAPWRPSDIEQREGRGIRQFNGELLGETLSKCWVFRYVTERLDALRWQTLQWKQEAFDQYLNGEDIDDAEDIGDVSYSYAQVKSLATGNPILIEESNLRAELNSLLVQQRNHAREQTNVLFKVERWKNTIDIAKQRIEKLEKDRSLVRDSQYNEETRKKINSAIASQFRELIENQVSKPQKILSYRGFDLYASASGLSDIFVTLQAANHYRFPFECGDKLIKLERLHVLDSIDTLIETLPEYPGVLQEQLERAEVEKLRCAELIGKGFSQSARIVEIQHRLIEINKVLEEAELIAAAVEQSQSQNQNDDVESGSSEFWLQDDKSMVNLRFEISSIINLLQARTVSPEWLSEIVCSVNEYDVEPKLTTIACIPQTTQIKEEVFTAVVAITKPRPTAQELLAKMPPSSPPRRSPSAKVENHEQLSLFN